MVRRTGRLEDKIRYFEYKRNIVFIKELLDWFTNTDVRNTYTWPN